MSFVNGDNVGDTVAKIHYDSSGTARRIEGSRDSTAWMATYMAGVLNVSNMIWVIFSLLTVGLRGPSVRRTGCSSGATRSSL